MSKIVSVQTRQKLSRAATGNKRAAGKHKMTPEGIAAIRAGQIRRWARVQQEKENMGDARHE